MRIAVTGASGHIGSEICRQLLSQGHQVRALVHRNIQPLTDLSLEIINGSLLDSDSLCQLMEGCDILIHTAGLIRLGYQYDKEIYDIHVTGTENVLKIARETGIKRVIHFSSIEVFNQHPLNLPITENRLFVSDKALYYARTKRDGHLLALKAANKGLDVVVLCPTSVIGPPDEGPSKMGKAIRDIYKGNIFAMVSGGFNFVDVRDVAVGTIHAIEKGKSGETYILGGGNYKIKELGDMILEIKGIRRRLLHLSLFWAYIGLPFVKLLAFITRTAPLYDKTYIEILQNSNPSVSSEKAIKELSFTTRNLKETLTDTIQWFKEKGRL